MCWRCYLFCLNAQVLGLCEKMFDVLLSNCSSILLADAVDRVEWRVFPMNWYELCGGWLFLLDQCYFLFFPWWGMYKLFKNFIQASVQIHSHAQGCHISLLIIDFVSNFYLIIINNLILSSIWTPLHIQFNILKIVDLYAFLLEKRWSFLLGFNFAL